MRLGRSVLAVGVCLGLMAGLAAGAGTVSQMSSDAPSSQPGVVFERFIPVAYCPKTDKPPKIDGVMDDACWQEAGTIGEFGSDKRDVLPTQQTFVRVIRDEKWLYFAIRCNEVDMAHQKVFRTGRTLPWDDDSIELFVDEKRGDSEYVHFGANVLGTNNLVAPKGDENAVLAAGKALDDAWVVEMRLLIQDEGEKGPENGDVWGLNINRNRFREKGTEYSNWSRLKGSSHFSDLFGLLVFCDKVPAVRVLNVQLGDRFVGGNVALVRLVADVAGDVRVSLGDRSASEERTVPLTAGAVGEIGVPYVLPAGRSSVAMVVGQDKPLLKTAFYATAVDRPQWAKSVKGVGAFSLQVPSEVIVQEEGFQPAVKAIWDGVQKGEPRVEWEYLLGGGEPSESVVRLPKIEKDMTDHSPVTLEAKVCNVQGHELVTLQRPVQIAGQRLAKWAELCKEYKRLAEKLLAEAKSDPMRLYAQKTAAKVTGLEGMIRQRDLAAGEAVQEIGYHLECLGKGKVPVWGHHELVYTSGIDGTEQPFFVSVPKDYDAKGKDRRPVVIWLHPFWGDGPWPRERLVDYMGNMERACMARGYLLVHPYGRGSQGYVGDGEADVWDVWKIVNERWRVDADRVYLAGFSMGGSGTLRHGMWYPERFAAGAAYSGLMREELVDNLRYLPMRLELGGQEPETPRMEQLARKIRAIDGREAETIFVAHPNEGHTEQYIDWPALLTWFSQYKRVVDPAVVSVVAEDLGHASRYWVGIEAFEEYGKTARADVQVKEGAIEVTTRNVAELLMAPPAKLVAADKPLRVMVNGKSVAVQREKDGRVRLTCGKLPDNGLSHQMQKSPALAGPVQAALGGPLVLVTAGEQEAWQEGAALITEQWQRWHHGELPAKVEARVQAEDMAGHNVILVGAWNSKGLMQKIRESGVVTIDEERIAVAGQEKKAAGQGIVFVQPNPLNPQRYVVVVTGQNEKGVLAACRMMAQGRYFGDYAVTDKGPQGVFGMWWR